MANSVMIGMEAEFELNGKDLTVFHILEHFFLAVYVFELSLRFFAYRLDMFRNAMSCFDLALVGSGVLSNWIIQPLLTSATDSAVVSELLSNILILRVLRLVRLVRAVRLFRFFRTLWLMIRGLVSSANAMIYTLLIIAMMIYLWSCASIELITKSARAHPSSPSYDEDWAKTVQTYYSGICSTMLTLIQFVILDSVRDAYLPLVTQEPLLMIFFISFMLVVSVSLMNLVTAVIVEASFQQAREDNEERDHARKMQIRKTMPIVRNLFHELDVDGSNAITMSEVTEATEELREKLMSVTRLETIEELFEILDADGSGEINIDEFCEGAMRFAMSDQPAEFIQMLKQMQIMRADVQSVKFGQAKILELLSAKFTHIEECLTRPTSNPISVKLSPAPSRNRVCTTTSDTPTSPNSMPLVEDALCVMKTHLSASLQDTHEIDLNDAACLGSQERQMNDCRRSCALSSLRSSGDREHTHNAELCSAMVGSLERRLVAYQTGLQELLDLDAVHLKKCQTAQRHIGSMYGTATEEDGLITSLRTEVPAVDTEDALDPLMTPQLTSWLPPEHKGQEELSDCDSFDSCTGTPAM